MRHGPRFADRVDAGRQLARALGDLSHRDGLVVLGLPRGGVPVAAEVARALGARLDVFVVRKLGVPGHEELAMGALAEGGLRIVDESMTRLLGIDRATVDAITVREQHELDRREQAYRGSRPRPDLTGRAVVLVDDGLATGATMEAAARAVGERGPAHLVVAAPVGAPDARERLRPYADAVVLVEVPYDLGAVGRWYEDFTPTSDDDVRRILAASTPVSAPGSS